RRGAGGMTDEEATALRAQFAMQHGMLSPSTTESFTSAAELQARAYRERFTALRRYQMEFIRWMQATTEKERIAGAEKVKVARDNLRALEQAFIGAALTGSPMQQISRFTNRDGRIQLVRTSREGVLTD